MRRLFATLITLTALFGVPAALAATEEAPGVALSPSSVAAGDTVVASSGGFVPGAPVEYSLTGIEGGPVRLATKTADEDGNVRASFVVPGGLGDRAPSVLVSGKAPGINVTKSATAQLTVEADGGPNAFRLVLLVLAVGLVGAVTVWQIRERRSG